jgi:hypothetical protein
MSDDPRTLRILFNNAIDDFSTQLTNTKSQLSQAQADLADTKSQLVQAQTDLATTQAQSTQTQAQLVSAQSDLANTKAQLVTAQGQISTAQTQLTQLTASAAAAKAGQFTYAAPPGAPVITGISPATGNPAGGDTITITGTGFTGVTTVTFGLVPATSFTFVSDTQITAVTPPGTAGGTVNVRITTPLGTSALPPTTS